MIASLANHNVFSSFRLRFLFLFLLLFFLVYNTYITVLVKSTINLDEMTKRQSENPPASFHIPLFWNLNAFQSFPFRRNFPFLQSEPSPNSNREKDRYIRGAIIQAAPRRTVSSMPWAWDMFHRKKLVFLLIITIILKIFSSSGQSFRSSGTNLKN